MPSVQETARSGPPARSRSVENSENSIRQRPGLKSAFVLGVATIAVAAVGAGMLVASGPAAPLVIALAVGLGIATMVIAGTHYSSRHPVALSPISESQMNQRTVDNFVPSNLQYPGVEPVDFDFDGH